MVFVFYKITKYFINTFILEELLYYNHLNISWHFGEYARPNEKINFEHHKNLHYGNEPK